MKKYIIGISLSLVALAGLTIGMRADVDAHAVRSL